MSEQPEPITDEEISLLKACGSEEEWNSTCDKIKKARGGKYPNDWWPKIVQSGMMKSIVSKFGGSTEITIRSY